MARFSALNPVARIVVVTLAGLILVAAGYALWLVAGPGPMDFASGHRAPPAAARPAAMNPSGVPAELAGADLIARGEYLARAADCSACHTADHGQAYAGGRGFVLPFGALYSTNITPDKETGIGNYSDADFLRVMHEGVAPGGKRLYPAMPYPSYTYMTDADALAIKAYLFSLPAVRASSPPNTLAFPFNQRWLMAVWSAALAPDKRFAVNGEYPPNGTAVPIWPKRWPIAASATPRAPWRSRWITVASMPDPSRPAGAPTTSLPIRRPASGTGPRSRWPNT